MAHSPRQGFPAPSPAGQGRAGQGKGELAILALSQYKQLSPLQSCTLCSEPRVHVLCAWAWPAIVFPLIATSAWQPGTPLASAGRSAGCEFRSSQWFVQHALAAQPIITVAAADTSGVESGVGATSQRWLAGLFTV